jgi:hypothetical protein
LSATSLSEVAHNGRTGTPVVLGDHTYTVYPQRIGYLENRLGKWISTLTNANVEGDDILAMLGDQVYGLLKVFIPKLMPYHEFRGFPSVADMESGNYDEAADASPSPDQIVVAFEVVTAVNRFDLFKHVGKLVDPHLLRAQATAMVAERLTGPSSVIESSTTTPDTTSTSSGTTPPTSTTSEGSPSLV